MFSNQKFDSASFGIVVLGKLLGDLIIKGGMDMTPKTNHRKSTHQHYNSIYALLLWSTMERYTCSKNIIWGKVPQLAYGEIYWDMGCILGGANITINGMLRHC